MGESGHKGTGKVADGGRAEGVRIPASGAGGRMREMGVEDVSKIVFVRLIGV